MAWKGIIFLDAELTFSDHHNADSASRMRSQKGKEAVIHVMAISVSHILEHGVPQLRTSIHLVQDEMATALD